MLGLGQIKNDRRKGPKPAYEKTSIARNFVFCLFEHRPNTESYTRTDVEEGKF